MTDTPTPNQIKKRGNLQLPVGTLQLQIACTCCRVWWKTASVLRNQYQFWPQRSSL